MSVEVQLVALDVFAGRHVLQEAGNGRIEAESAGLVEEGKPSVEECRPIDLPPPPGRHP